MKEPYKILLAIILIVLIGATLELFQQNRIKRQALIEANERNERYESFIDSLNVELYLSKIAEDSLETVKDSELNKLKSINSNKINYVTKYVPNYIDVMPWSVVVKRDTISAIVKRIERLDSELLDLLNREATKQRHYIDSARFNSITRTRPNR
jgi:hypothetical protein